MKILSYESKGAARVGAHIAEGVIDLAAALRTTHPSLAHTESVLAIVQSGLDIDRFASESIAELRATNRLARFVVEKPVYLPPVVNPPKILALALNFQEHIDETNMKFYAEPIVFAKYPSNMVGHEAEIELPPFPQKVDEEHELGLVVGRDCRHITASQAVDYVFGWTICNDVSARNRQRERGQMGQPYAYAKNFASFAPMGPWIVTAKELPDPRGLKMSCKINGKVRREGNSANMIFNPFEVLAYCSDYTPMKAGDIISLGTYSGDKEIKAGDLIEMEVEKIGTLRNKVVAAKAAWPNFTADQPTGPLVKENR